MANMPRILPLVFVAVGGVLAMKAITSLDVLPDIFHKAEAVAQAAGPKPAAKPVAKAKEAPKVAGAEASKSDDPTEAFSVSPAMKAADAGASASNAAAVAPITPLCPTSVNELAKEAGISPNELQILQSLGQRRAELDQREQTLDSRAQLIQAADDKLDSRITQLQSLKTQIQALIDQANKTSSDDTVRMVKVYEAMKPKDAAAVLTSMSDDVRLPIAAGMKDRALAAILGAMSPDAARELTEKLTNRMKQAGGLQQKLDKVTSAPTASAASSSSLSGAGASTSATASTAPTGKKPAPGAKAKPAKAKG